MMIILILMLGPLIDGYNKDFNILTWFMLLPASIFALVAWGGEPSWALATYASAISFMFAFFVGYTLGLFRKKTED